MSAVAPGHFKVLRANAYARMPWKNGGGETREIAIFPPAANLDTLDWRISMAVVAQDGPFSSFPGIDRTLCVIEGAGMELDFGAGGGIQTVARRRRRSNSLRTSRCRRDSSTARSPI